MKTRLIVLSLAVLSAAAFGQGGNPFMDMMGGGGGQSKPAWTEFKLPKKTMKLDFRNANVDMVLSLFTKTSGITIVKDPTLTQPITLTSAKAVPLDQAFEILNAALSVRNFELRKEGSLLVVRAKQQRGAQSGRGTMPTGIDFSSLMGGQGELKVYQIQFANASQVARVINEVFAQQNNPLSGIMQMMAAGQQGGRGGGRFGGFGGGGSSNVRASSDDYSNTVIVNAPSSTHRQVEDLIKQIDKQTDEPQKAKVYKMNYASAADLQPVVQGVLTANLPRGRGGVNAGQNNQGGGGGFFPFFGGGGGQNAQRAQLLQGAVVTDQRTNSLVVTTTEQNHKLIDEVVKSLDTEVKLESTTFVFPLENARADQIATLMRQAFGQRSGTGQTGQNRNNAGGTNTGRTNSGRTNLGGGGGGVGGGGIGGGGANNNLEVLLEDPTQDSGELQTNVAVQGGGIFGQLFGGGGQNQNQNRQNVPLGRDSQGRLVPVQDMTNQITVIPDQNTNSIIVVTTPENAEMLRQILAQLDKIPEQVMIETMIVEATLGSSDKLGVEWQLTTEKVFNDTGVTGTGAQGFGMDRAGQGFRYTLSGGALTAFINALKTDTKFNVLSTPKIFTSNNVTAEINISQRVPFVVSQRTDANGNITYNYDFEDVGIVLNVTPRITSGGYVTMEVSQTANDLQGFTDFNAPIVNQRQAETTIAVKDGETVILGGIMRSTVTATTKKVPLLGDLPVLGNLFRSTDKEKSKTELMVFLTPRVVRNPEDAAKITEEEKKKLSKPTQDQLNKTGGGSVKTNDTKKAGGN